MDPFKASMKLRLKVVSPSNRSKINPKLTLFDRKMLFNEALSFNLYVIACENRDCCCEFT